MWTMAPLLARALLDQAGAISAIRGPAGARKGLDGGGDEALPDDQGVPVVQGPRKPNMGSRVAGNWAAFSADAAETAVSNAVPWSRRKDDGTNANPSPEMIGWAVAFWKDMLPLIRPSRIITAGRVAQTVITLADPSAEYCRSCLRLPSPQAMSRVSGMFRKEDLLARYPEVRQVGERHPEWESSLNKVFFACHAVSAGSTAGGSVQGDTADTASQHG